MDEYDDRLQQEKEEILERQREALERPLLAKIDELVVVVRGLANANPRDMEHILALQRMAKQAMKGY